MFQYEYDTAFQNSDNLYNGQILYLVTLGGVSELLLLKSFSIGGIERYSSKILSYIGGHKTFSSDDIGKTIFLSKKNADNALKRMVESYNLYIPERIKMPHSFISYTPEQFHGNGNPLVVEAHIAVIDDCMLYIQRFADYAYMTKYSNHEELEQKYMYMLNEMKEYHFSSNVSKEIFGIETTIKSMYQISDDTYAEADYITKFKERK